jgi:hypothetical protein
MSTLNEVLRAFENVSKPLSLDELSRRMSMERGALEGAIQFWVRKGRLKEVGGSPDGGDCPSCSSRASCPYVLSLPKSYVLARPD